MIFPALPLKRMVLTQPFGGNYGPTPDFYTKLGLRGHDGIDLSAPDGTECYAVCDATVKLQGENPGYGNNVRLRTKEFGLEIIYGHLKEFRVTDGQEVKAGDLLALTDNTGMSSGPHLHFETRPVVWHIDGSGPYKLYPGNGYGGAVDPRPFLPPDVFDLPVDKRYGLTPLTLGVPSEFAFLGAMTYFWKTQKRLMTTREYNALRFGFWPLRDVLDPAIFPVWSEMPYPTAREKGIVK